jgi:hypothetical protein
MEEGKHRHSTRQYNTTMQWNSVFFMKNDDWGNEEHTDCRTGMELRVVH